MNVAKPRKIKPEGADGHRSRMFAKFLNSSQGDVQLRDVIEMLLYYSVRVRDTRDSAVELMKKYGGDARRLLSAPPDELCQTEDIGPRSALLLNVVGEIVSRLDSETDVPDKACAPDESDILYALLDVCLQLTDDAVAVIFYGLLGEPLDTYIFDTSPKCFDQNDMYRLMSMAAGYNSTSVAVAHLTGDPDMFPNADDTRFKRYISDALQTTGLTLLEYYYINKDEAISLSQQ